ncbi:putative glycerophosphodiester phosphodiesterase [Lupinus albus]|uniref:Putative glycerophosphodiester phosphodiesterase n=1 Tax=Lupinus albus TaxID=3870 RepID=A0A6A4PR41_LUPAL|nr:putative glycerophosphodiester phosphodiesterase [Lupinus albus]
MLLMEMATRRKNLNAFAEDSNQIYFPFWVYGQLQDGHTPQIENDTEEEMKLATRMMLVALWCIQTRPSDRPSMLKVLEMLEQDQDIQLPPKPYLYPQDTTSEEEEVIDNISSTSDISISESKEST